MAWVLYGVEHGVSYLHGQIIASLLERLTEKGVIVTLVLDCCFSGRRLRNGRLDDASIRTAKYHPEADSSPHPEDSDAIDGDISSIRDGIPLPTWLANPNYTILTACGPHEIAEELDVKTLDGFGNEKRGALSYFLLEALISLRRSSMLVTSLSLHQHLLMKFHTHWPRQAPMRRGNKNLSFLGRLQPSNSRFDCIPIFKTGAGRICLDAGHIHDVHENDEYALYPFDAPERALQTTLGSKFRVESVGCLTSDLIAADSVSIASIDTGWKARLLNQFPAWKTSVRLAPNAVSNNGMTPWIKALEHRSSVSLLAPDQEPNQHCAFTVVLNSRKELQVVDDSDQELSGFPCVAISHKTAIPQTVAMLQHLAKFQRFGAIENLLPSLSFE